MKWVIGASQIPSLVFRWTLKPVWRASVWNARQVRRFSIFLSKQAGRTNQWVWRQVHRAYIFIPSLVFRWTLKPVWRAFAWSAKQIRRSIVFTSKQVSRVSQWAWRQVRIRTKLMRRQLRRSGMLRPATHLVIVLAVLAGLGLWLDDQIIWTSVSGVGSTSSTVFRYIWWGVGGIIGVALVVWLARSIWNRSATPSGGWGSISNTTFLSVLLVFLGALTFHWLWYAISPEAWSAWYEGRLFWPMNVATMLIALLMSQTVKAIRILGFALGVLVVVATWVGAAGYFPSQATGVKKLVVVAATAPTTTTTTIMIKTGEPATVNVPPGYRWDLVGTVPTSGWTTDAGQRDARGNRIQIFEVVTPTKEIKLEVQIKRCTTAQMCAW